MGKWSGKACRLISMLVLTFSFFIVELVVGYATKSLALVADSFHMLSDVVALIVGLLSVRYSKKGSSKKNTFGWARAEVLGANVNAVFLVALCFTIFVEAIQRMVELESITDPKLLLIVGGIGLFINLVGLALFHNQAHGHSHGGGGHGHSHGGKKAGHGHSHNGRHGHSHNGDSHSHEKKLLKDEQVTLDAGLSDSENEISIGVPQKDGSIRNVTHTKDPKQGQERLPIIRKEKKASAEQLNMKGVFLHVLGDALGSVIVMVSAIIYLTVPKVCEVLDEATTTTTLSTTTVNGSALLNMSTTTSVADTCTLVSPPWVNYIDPILSLILVAIILTTSIPLVKDSGMILMQTVPTHIVVSKMQTELEQLDGVLAVHEFHVWSLAGDKIVASLHLHLRSLEDYVRVSNEVKEYFHDEGIHSVTIQPEFLDLHVKKAGRECLLECGPEKDCHPATCCSVSQKAPSLANSESQAKAMDNGNIGLEDVLILPTASTSADAATA